MTPTRVLLPQRPVSPPQLAPLAHPSATPPRKGACPNASAHVERRGLRARALAGERRLTAGECPSCNRTLVVTAAPGLDSVLPPAPEPPAPPILRGHALSHCRGPRLPHVEELGDGASAILGGMQGGACFLHPVAYWCRGCLETLSLALLQLAREA